MYSETEDVMKDILENHISGFHRCYLENPIHLEYASDNLCRMVGYSQEEMSELFNNKYIFMVHPDDRERYREYVYKLAAEERKLSIEYRMITKGGDCIYVMETMSSKRDDEGIMRGYSVVYQKEGFVLTSDVMERIYRTIECGIIDFIEKDVFSLISMNDVMKKKLGIEMKDREYENELAGNILFLFEYSSRTRFVEIIKGLKTSGDMATFSLNMLKTNSLILEASGFVIRLAHGSYRMIILDNPETKRLDEEKKDIRNVMASLFSNSIEFDIENNRTRFLCADDYGFPEQLKEIGMDMDKANSFWITNMVERKDRQRVQEYLDKNLKNVTDGHVAEDIFFDGYDISGKQSHCCGIFISVNCNTKLFCYDFVNTEGKSSHNIRINTFGNFSVYVDDELVLFKSEKARELLAVLVDKRGNNLSNSEGIRYLWEGEKIDKTTQARYRKVVMNMMNTLKEYDIEDIILSSRGQKALDIRKVSCDLFDYMNGEKEKYSKELYMIDYPWSEYSFAMLMD